jgi:hypothetical protein
MNTTNVLWQVAELVDSADGVREALLAKCARLAKSGAVDLDSMANDDYTAAKAILTVALRDIADTVNPLCYEGKEMVDNLSNF